MMTLHVSSISRTLNISCLLNTCIRNHNKYLQFIFFSQIFCDFGEGFTVVDTNGEQPISNMISSVTKVTF